MVLTEVPPTLVAAVAFLARVGKLVCVQIFLCFEGGAAFTALVWPFLAVDALVLQQNDAAQEGFATLVTGVRPLPRMAALMDLQQRAGDVLLVTVAAAEETDARVQPLVLRQPLLSAEGFAAVVTFVPDPTVAPFVDREPFPRGEGLITLVTWVHSLHKVALLMLFELEQTPVILATVTAGEFGVGVRGHVDGELTGTGEHLPTLFTFGDWGRLGLVPRHVLLQPGFVGEAFPTLVAGERLFCGAGVLFFHH